MPGMPAYALGGGGASQATEAQLEHRLLNAKTDEERAEVVRMLAQLRNIRPRRGEETR